ncbi:class I SAM-dependent methyltransferase [Pikeienuella sp. HZG-20]|uniref:class I SAM-dependent methyltransferase n=1 Tax=Paludibacillus litoralis TaxID=3133267 RepID=UPI0030EC7BB4
MHLDVIDLRRFYYHTPLGRVAQMAIRSALAAHWPDARSENFAAFGFGQPFIRPFRRRAQRAVGLMPAQMGAFHWPAEAANLSVLTDERRWPLATGFVDRLLIVHALETTSRPGAVLAEANRVLAPGGRALIVVPNRTGLWARREATPFGHGQPYSISQLKRLLRDHRLEPVGHSAALYAPPSQRRFWLRMARASEAVGRKLDAQRFAGVIVVEAVKAAYAAPGNGSPVTSKTPLEVLGGMVRPTPKPVVGQTREVAGRPAAEPLNHPRERVEE